MEKCWICYANDYLIVIYTKLFDFFLERSVTPNTDHFSHLVSRLVLSFKMRSVQHIQFGWSCNAYQRHNDL